MGVDRIYDSQAEVIAIPGKRIFLVETIPKQLPGKLKGSSPHFSNHLLSNWTKNFMARTIIWWNGTDNRTRKKLMDFK